MSGSWVRVPVDPRVAQWALTWLPVVTEVRGIDELSLLVGRPLDDDEVHAQWWAESWPVPVVEWRESVDGGTAPEVVGAARWTPREPLPAGCPMVSVVLWVDD